MKLITIAIPTYNGEKNLPIYLPRSILDSDEVEYLIIDDGSKDKTLEVANALAKKYKNVRVFHQENKGFGGAYNAGIKNATGKYIYFLDCDDYLNTETLKHNLEIIKHNKETIDVYINPFNYEYSDGRVRKDDAIKFAVLDRPFSPNEVKPFTNTTFFMNHNVTVRRELLIKYKLDLPHCHYCDNQFIAYLFLYADKMMFIDKIICHYRIGALTQSVSNESVKRNYEHYWKTLLSMVKMTDNDKYKALDKHTRKLYLHYFFVTAIMGFYATYLDNDKSRHKLFKKYMKETKEANPYMYKQVCNHTTFRVRYITPVAFRKASVIIGRKLFTKNLPWQ